MPIKEKGTKSKVEGKLLMFVLEVHLFQLKGSLAIEKTRSL